MIAPDFLQKLKRPVDDSYYFYKKLNADFPWFEKLNEDRKLILIEMCYMGYKKFLTFKKMLEYMQKKDYGYAAYEMLDSNWAKQVKKKAASLAFGMLNGIYY